MTIRYLNWKLDLNELKTEINNMYLDTKDNIKRVEDKANRQIKSNKDSIMLYTIGIFVEILFGIMIGFTLFDLVIILLFILQILVKECHNKRIKINTELISLSVFINSYIGRSLVMSCDLNDLLKIDIPGKLGEKLKYYDVIINSDIRSIKYIDDKLTIVTNNDEVEIGIPVYVRDGDCDAITINSSGVFIGLHKNVALRDITTKEVNIPIIISRKGEETND